MEQTNPEKISANIKTGGALELYVHIPFCVRKCGYCDFLSAPADNVTISRYVACLQHEIAYKAACLTDRSVCSIFFGGGTPSLLSAKQVADLMASIRAHFFVEPDAEVTMECNPGVFCGGWRQPDGISVVSPYGHALKQLAAIRKAGVNRLSIGAQSMHDSELATLGRIHQKEDILRCFEAARAAGFQNINVDLIYGIPGQTKVSFLTTLQQVCALLPEHLSIYRLMIEEGTPFFERYHADELQRDAGEIPSLLPAEEEEAGMEQAISAILPAHGYARYEISNYARKGKTCRHNIGYWTGVPYLGLGLGAASMLREVNAHAAAVLGLAQEGSWRFSNTKELAAYLSGHYVSSDAVKLTREMQMEEFMFLGLRMLCGVSKSAFYERFRRPAGIVYGAQIDRLKKQGLLEETETMIRLTPGGVSFGNVVFAEFLD